jgi:GT2 family glycosyltransferase
MKLSVVILCWNDLKVIAACLRSLYEGTRVVDFEVIVSDNGSTDGSIEFIRQNYPETRFIENRKNLGFAGGNNAGIRESYGELILILNPDTILHDGALDRLVAFADQHPEAGGFGCRVVNPNGSYQITARPFPTIWRYWLRAFWLQRLAHVSDIFISDHYSRWKGDRERVVDWQSGCCVMFRSDLLKRLGGFDEQFFYTYEEVDLCRRVWNAGYPILFTPQATVTHLGGQSVNRFPVRFELERHRNAYRYFYKHFGAQGARRCRRTLLVWLRVRQCGYAALGLFRPSDAIRGRLETYRVVARWTKRLDPVRFVEKGEEPDLTRQGLLQTS